MTGYWGWMSLVVVVGARTSGWCDSLVVNGTRYDLSSIPPVQGLLSADSEYSASVCGPVTPPQGCPPILDCSGYRVEPEERCFCLGRFMSGMWRQVPTGLEVTYYQGDGGRRLIAQINCGRPAALPTNVTEIMAYAFELTWVSPAACTTTDDRYVDL
eukprot:c15278_g1_i1.p2 GENE.c15278_g1_i1~~c15278_g1_i1.p2  ORF type:complete len:169 (+),score=5.30 c15278_g1_i1:38-508(+)